MKYSNSCTIITAVRILPQKLGIAGKLLAFVASMLLPSETEVLADVVIRRFEEVNRRLTGIERQLQRATSSIRVAQETAETLRPYRDCHNAVRNGAQKRSDIMIRMQTARTKHQLTRLAEEFTNWYETSELDARLSNLHRVATRETTSDVGQNLFQSYIELHSCSTSRLAELMLGVVHDMELGYELQMAYHFFRNGAGRASEQLLKAKTDLYQLRSAFDRYYWYCLENTKTMASQVVRNLMEESSRRDTIAKASHVLTGLENRFHRFKWAVAVGVTDLLQTSTLGAENYFMLPTAPSVLVSFADSEQSLRCSDVNLTSTRLIFRCPSDSCAVVASTGTIGSRSCRGVSTLGADVGSDWLVSMLSNQAEPCSSPDACSGHGVCRHGAGLTRGVCQCETEFQGDRCAFKDDSSTVSAKLIADMRDSVGQFTGVHTTVDVYYQLLDVQSTLTRELRGLSACTDLNRLVSSDTISEAMYMAELNAQLLKGSRTLNQFGELMHSHVGSRNLEFFLKSLLHKLLGTNQFGIPGRGMVQLFKRCLALNLRSPMCGERYSKSVQRLITGLALMDEAVGESLLTYFSWKKDRTNSADKIVLAYLTKEYKNRTMQFRDHWKSQSCPALRRPLDPNLSDWNQRFCNDSHSFEGLTLNVTCSAGLWRPRSPYITCRRLSDGRLEWSDEPHCDREWSEWSSWSHCSVTCGSGQQTRHRCLGDDCTRRDFSSKSCTRIDCCVARYGDGNFFRCRHSGGSQCIQKDRVCDGIPDCSDGSDESGCNFVRAGNRVSLRIKSGQAYAINCYCTSRCLFQPVFCDLKYCSNWHTGCSSEHTHFYIYSPERKWGEVIQSGDTVGLMYDWHPYGWLSCVGGKCTTRSCPGNDASRLGSPCAGEKFTIYSVQNDGRCRGHRNCVGRPIRGGEFVALKFSNGWLSGPAMDSPVQIRHCLWRTSMSRAPGCPHEVWKIYL
ncbi:hypothetical protein BOX15_Mlig007853g1 [Macrostomum lignano]|uniref:EGF-like domain-containing protein n=1 Tax=Macrostomum lignano TaxID=282301 RepID=A0A267G8W7_9PLAT|nr:hypothetical protein BOX15_Mlig007853g1 [Macrostomum lignano]